MSGYLSKCSERAKVPFSLESDYENHYAKRTIATTESNIKKQMKLKSDIS